MIPGLKIILMGPPGSGKTHAIRTLIDADLEVFCILTEPNAINTLTNYRNSTPAYRNAITDGQLHWKFIQPSKAGWDSMLKSAKLLTHSTLGSLQKLPAPDKRDYTQFYEVLDTCSNFVDDITGKELGPVDNLDPLKQVLVIDSLSGLNDMFLSLVTGSKPVKSLPEWGAAIDAEMRFVNHLCFGILSHVVLMAHVTRETDEVLGGIKIMVSALGRKAPQELPRYFTDCILTKHEAGSFSWTTADSRAETKATTLEAGEKLEPTFVPLIKEWRSRLTSTETGVTDG